MASDHRDIAIQILGILGNIASSTFFLSSMPTVIRMVRKRSSGGLTGDLYVVKLFNCCLWVLYACPHLGRPHAFWVLLTNALGAAFALVYIIPYCCYSTKSQRFSVLWKLSVVILSLAFMVASALLMLHSREKKIIVIGLMCAVVSSAMHLSLLSQAGDAVKFKNPKYLHPYSSIAAFLKGAVWTAFGLVTRDMYIVIPNGVGIIIGCVEMILAMVLYLMRKFAGRDLDEKSNTKNSKSTNENQIEKIQTQETHKVTTEKQIEVIQNQETHKVDLELGVHQNMKDPSKEEDSMSRATSDSKRWSFRTGPPSTIVPLDHDDNNVGTPNLDVEFTQDLEQGSNTWEPTHMVHTSFQPIMLGSKT